MRTLALGLVLAACSSPSSAPPEAGSVTVSGEVVSVDLDPIAYDGNAVLMLRTDTGERRVEIPARTNLCAADGLGIAFNATPGERLTVVGAEQSPGGVVVPCTSSAHLVRRG